MSVFLVSELVDCKKFRLSALQAEASVQEGLETMASRGAARCRERNARCGCDK